MNILNVLHHFCPIHRPLRGTYVWFDIAAAEKDRDHVAAKLDATSLAEAQKLSKAYFTLYVEPFQ